MLSCQISYSFSPHAATQTSDGQPSFAASTASLSVQPEKIYDGDYGQGGVRLRIANGGAGQSGLIGAWANAFIKYCHEQKGIAPFKVAWYLGDTTESLGYLAQGIVDIAVTYNEAAEAQALKSKVAVNNVYGFRDHFYLVGPKCDPARLAQCEQDALVMFNRIVSQGNQDTRIAVQTPPTDHPATRFLSRFDKSATNIKESLLFCEIGQVRRADTWYIVPWALPYSKWYHQYPRFPLEALEAASVLKEYTLTDRGIWLSSPPSVTSTMDIFIAGSDDKKNDPLLNPAHVLLGKKAKGSDQEIWNSFMKWVVWSQGGQKIIENFKKPDGPHGKQLYSIAPPNTDA
ncbi:hypothetical protein F5I97DRAFT_1804275 [Phlebopus sp. FC_14]|nr:hypothetical protein F5I97DRAFT_1804275 [Phlebopus sp. FC_14]